jgi:MinD superfamily P-loop ATPase
MKQLLILSGKGGTGKTTLASAFIKLADAKVYADCDVDAPNLHLLMGQSSKPKRTDYYGLPKAEIDQEFCIKCDLCRQFCRFDAINENQEYQVDSYACEGCGVGIINEEIRCPPEGLTNTSFDTFLIYRYCYSHKNPSFCFWLFCPFLHQGYTDLRKASALSVLSQ